MISLGINYSTMHDSSACIARDGDVLFAVAEERLSRVKHDARFPVLAIRACLNFLGVSPSDLDFVCQSWPTPGIQLRHDFKCMLIGSLPVSSAGILQLLRGYASARLQQGGRRPFVQSFGDTRASFRFVDHHLAHAISAYAYSGFVDAAVLVIDGRGAWEATSLWHGRNGRLEHKWTIPWPNSLGLYYAQFTHFLGFTPYSDEWKVMGLAPYGAPGIILLNSLVRMRIHIGLHAPANRSAFGSDWPHRITPRPSRIPESELTASHKNLAFAVQDSCEVAMLSLARAAAEPRPERVICASLAESH